MPNAPVPATAEGMPAYKTACEIHDDISPALDGLIDNLEQEGVSWYVLTGSTYQGTYLAFELPSNAVLPSGEVAAMMRFDRQFRINAAIRQEAIARAAVIGAAFYEKL